VLAPCGIKRQPEGIGAGSLGQVGQSVAGFARAFSPNSNLCLAFQRSRRDFQKAAALITIDL
jgi:hypothetical protein